jgi:gas vesicle protein
MMRRLMFFIGGALLGMMFGTTVTLLLTPASGNAMRRGAKNRFQEIVGDAKLASEAKRRELEAELQVLTGTTINKSITRR